MKLPAGLANGDNKRLEFWEESGTVYAFYKSVKTHFLNVPEHILVEFRKEIKSDAELRKEIGITDGMHRNEALELYLKAEYGDLDDIADIDENGITHRERTVQKVIKESNLSSREVEVLSLIATGLKVPEIAKRLFIAPGTVEVHSNHIKEKIGVNERVRMARFAIRNKLVTA